MKAQEPILRGAEILLHFEENLGCGFSQFYINDSFYVKQQSFFINIAV